MKGKDSHFLKNEVFEFRGKTIDLSTPKVMGVINVTPDSFFDGGLNDSKEKALLQTEKLLSEGADIIDVGGYSSKPGASNVSEEMELARVLPVIQALVKRFNNIVISVDTFRGAVAKAAISAGATIVNDISAGSIDESMLPFIVKEKVPYIAMHMRGTPQTMQSFCDYKNVAEEVGVELLNRLSILSKDHPLIIDPGFGFSKTLEQNYELLNDLDYFKRYTQPVLVGVSRKSMIYKVLKNSAKDALNGTTCLNTVALLKGAKILRVHDVKEAKQAVELVSWLCKTS